MNKKPLSLRIVKDLTIVLIALVIIGELSISLLYPSNFLGLFTAFYSPILVIFMMASLFLYAGIKEYWLSINKRPYRFFRLLIIEITISIFAAILVFYIPMKFIISNHKAIEAEAMSIMFLMPTIVISGPILSLLINGVLFLLHKKPRENT